MNALSLLKSLAPGFVPLFAYIAADLLFGETIGLFVGLGIGALEFIVSLVREKKADLFIAGDTLLLAAMGALSLILRNQIFFRLKPAIMEGIVALSMGFLLVLPKETLKAYMGHQVKGLVLQDEGMPALRRSLVLMVAVLALHTGLTVWAALAASTALWGFRLGRPPLHPPRPRHFAVQWVTARAKGRGKGAAVGTVGFPAIAGWVLLIFDEAGRIYSEKVPAASIDLWDSPARGRMTGAAGLEASLEQVFARLGIGPVAVSPAFILDAKGAIQSIQPIQPSQDSSSLSAFLSSLEPGADFVLATTIPLARFPKGVDPTGRRFWQLPDLLSLASTGKLDPSFARELGALSVLRHPLRGEAPASIVSDTNDAAI